MLSLIWLVGILADILFWLIIIAFLIDIMSRFDIINSRNALVHQARYSIDSILAPITAPIRKVLNKFIPSSTIDISPVVLLIILHFIQHLMKEMFL